MIPIIIPSHPIIKHFKNHLSVIMINKESDNKEKNRYSDEELEEFHVMIEKKLDEARKQLDALREQLTELNEMGETSRAGTFEDGASNWQREHVNKLASRQQRFIRDLENAMVRIKNKTYGICSVTGKLIDKKRLMAVPHATKSVEGKQALEDEENKTKRPLVQRDRPLQKVPAKKILSKVLTPKKRAEGEDGETVMPEDEDFMDDEAIGSDLDLDGLIIEDSEE